MYIVRMAHMVLLNTNLLMANDITQGNDAFQTNITVPAIEKTMSRKKYVFYPFFVPVIEPLYMTKKSCKSKKDNRFCKTGLRIMPRTIC